MAELRNIKWTKLIKSLLEKDSLDALTISRSLQWWLTKGFRKNGYLLIDDLKDLILEYKGVKFYPDLMNYPRVFEAWDRYYIEKVEPKDIVLDLGANIGSYSLPCALKGCEVYSIEPIYKEELRFNAVLNKVWGPGHLTDWYMSLYENTVDCQERIYHSDSVLSFNKVIDILAPKTPTVIRMDIGGAEWYTRPKEILDLTPRLLEIEFHFYTEKEQRLADWECWKTFLSHYNYGYVARWSKHKHWLYLSAERNGKIRQEVQLVDGSFRDSTKLQWHP